MHLAALHIYPVKSLRGVSVASSAVDPLGLCGDRRFLVVDEADRFLTQRSLPRMALVEASLGEDKLFLKAPGFDRLSVGRVPDPSAPLRRVTIWANQGLTEDCGDESARWLTRFLGQPCRLVRIGPAFERPVKPSKALPGEHVHFADAYPFMMLSEATVADLNRRLAQKGEEPVPMNRFRPNFVISGSEPYAEDRWQSVRIGEMVFRVSGPCARCVITTTHQETAERGQEPLATLAGYRRDPAQPTNINFGQNLIHETKVGKIRIGDPVLVIS